jgi:hypothetical protein
MKIDPDDLPGGSDNGDWLRDKALRVRLDRTPVNGHVQKTKRSAVIRYFGSRRSLGPTSQNHSSAVTSTRASISGRQRHGANNRASRTGTCHGRRRSERG